jgi:TctA family transporter
MLAVLGITFVASLSGEALVKGLLAGGLGLWLATIGLYALFEKGLGVPFPPGQVFVWLGYGG